MAYNFKSEEEVKEFLNNIGTEYRFSCFKEKNAEGCHLLGDYLESFKKDFENAADVYKSNCDERNFTKSCLKFANFSYLSKGLDGDMLTAFNYYEKACNLNSADGCLYAGVMLTTGEAFKSRKEIIKKDYVKGLKYLEKACSEGNTNACYFGSGIYISGAEGVPQNRTKASELSLLACNGGNIYSCMNLSRMYKIGDGVEKDEKKSEFYKNKAHEIRDDLKKKPSIGLQQYS